MEKWRIAIAATCIYLAESYLLDLVEALRVPLPPALFEVCQEYLDFELACIQLATMFAVDQRTAAERLALISRQTGRPWRFWVDYFKLNDGWIGCTEESLPDWARGTVLREIAKKVAESTPPDTSP